MTHLVKSFTKLGWMVVFLVATYMLSRSSTINYSPDSWSYIDIARSLIDKNRDIGEILGVRDYSNEPWINDSFPFLWPLLLIPGIILLGPTAPVGGWLFVLLWLLTGRVLLSITRFFNLSDGIAPVWALVLLLLPGYLDEGHAGRSIPLTIFLLALSLYLLIRHNKSIIANSFLGITLGLCAANRFDSLLYGPVLIALAFVFRFIDLKRTILTFFCWSLFPMMWTLYSLTKLNGFYVTDNSRVGLSSLPTFVTDWPIESLSSDPNVIGLFVKAASNADTLARSLLSAFYIWIILIGVSLMITRLPPFKIHKKFRSLMKESPDNSDKNHLGLLVLAFTIFVFFLQVSLILFTGYGDKRYWAVFAFLLTYLTLVWFSEVVKSWALKYSSAPPLSLWVVIPLVFAVFGIAGAGYEFHKVANQATYDYSRLKCLKLIDGVSIVPGLEAFRIPATSNVRLATPPNNANSLSPQDWTDLAKKYSIKTWVNIDSNPPTKMPENASFILKEYNCP